jgi:hypothetical protein
MEVEQQCKKSKDIEKRGKLKKEEILDMEEQVTKTVQELRDIPRM